MANGVSSKVLQFLPTNLETYLILLSLFTAFMCSSLHELSSPSKPSQASLQLSPPSATTHAADEPTLVGKLVGCTLGRRDGIFDGFELGSLLGLSLGTNDGTTDGILLGLTDGALLGILVGESLGIDEGLRLGKADG